MDPSPIFYNSDVNIFKSVKTEVRNSIKKHFDGKVLSEVKNITFPVTWSQAATDIMADKYFRKNIGVKDKVVGETSYEQPIHRIANHWTTVGLEEGYFNEKEAKIYYNQMAYMMIHQLGAPNSPQWFNTGLHQAYGITGPAQGHYYIAVRPKDERKLNSSPQQQNTDDFVEVGSELVKKSEDAYQRPQVHACFIQSIKDDLLNQGGILSLYTREATVFKYGSGSGTNFSDLRGKGEALSGGGTSSGLLSWLVGSDRIAGAIKSGGTTRRAAKMDILDIDHPDIEEFINWKTKEEKKAKALIAAGYPSDYEGEAYATVSGQNSNNSIRVNDEFMQAVEEDKNWNLTWRTNGKVCKTLKARDLWKQICQCAWECADPGLQYDTTINAMNTCLKDGKIRGSNPCVTGDTLVRTSKGDIRIDSMLKGEYEIYGSDGKLHPVQSSFVTGVKSVYELKTKSGISLKLTADHKVSTQNRGDVPALELKDDDILKLYSTSNQMSEDKFHSLTYSGDETVYDITEPDTHHFIANGIVVANCSEYMFLDDTACNLASLNLVHFFDFKTKTFLFDKYVAAVDYWTTTLDISVTLAQYPSKEIALNTFYYRTLGLGYANLGTIIMKLGLAYDSDEGRAVAGMLTSLMGAVSYLTSAKLAKKFGAFPRFERNRDQMMKVVRKHSASNNDIKYNLVDKVLANTNLKDKINDVWSTAVDLGDEFGYRNAQTTLLAPTGTIGFIMDCDTTGVEPEYSLFKWKKLAGGGGMMIVNPNIPETLQHLGYSSSQIDSINAHLKVNQCMEGAHELKEIHLAIFDTAQRNGKGKRFIAPIGHVKMMAAVQPFLSGAISKTVNMPEDSTVDDIAYIYMQSWKMGVKAVALYRDNCKSSQPLSSTNEEKKDDSSLTKIAELEKQLAEIKNQNKSLEDKLLAYEKNPQDVLPFLNKTKLISNSQLSTLNIAELIAGDKKSPHNDVVKVIGHRRLPYLRSGKTIGAQIAGQKIFIRTGEYEDGSLAEIFLDMYKEGSSFRNMLNLFAISVSIALQSGAKLEKLVDKFTFTSFEPSGLVKGHPYIKKCSSIPDFVFRVLALMYLNRYDLCHVHPEKIDSDDELTPINKPEGKIGSSPVCTACGSMTVRSGTCFTCTNCGK
jgi:ribonucleotide reductase alpha subunit